MTVTETTSAVRPGVAFTLLSGLVCVLAWLLADRAPGFYYQWIQEDGPLEWASFWAFALAGCLWLRSLRDSARSPWRTCYLLGLGVGCLAVALEEISWGQRVFGYLPPEAFLTGNYQQELNLHNFADSDTRQLLLYLLLGGFGVAWPLFARIGMIAGWLMRQHIRAPGVAVIPGFLLAVLLQSSYPWHATGEWVELLAGLGMLTCAAEISIGPAVEKTLPVLAGLLIAMTLGYVTAAVMPAADDQSRITVAEQETRALAGDFATRRLRSRCGVHKRLYTFVEQYGARRMAQSEFFAGVENSADDVRKRHYLDPWNLPYWIRHRCDAGESVAFVYSFGPNRRRDSSESALAGDDVGWIVGRRKGPED